MIGHVYRNLVNPENIMSILSHLPQVINTLELDSSLRELTTGFHECTETRKPRILRQPLLISIVNLLHDDCDL